MRQLQFWQLERIVRSALSPIFRTPLELRPVSLAYDTKNCILDFMCIKCLNTQQHTERDAIIINTSVESLLGDHYT